MKIHYDIRNQHIYIPGKTRQGKSTLLEHMIVGDILNGAGVCVIDPKGDMASRLLHFIPESRKDDCIYIDPDNPIPIEFLDYGSQREKQTVVGELKHIIKKGMSDDGAVLMNAIMNDLIYTLLEARENGANVTFLDIHDFLAFDYRREEILNGPDPAHPFVRSKRYRERWKDMPNLKDRQPTLTRMSDFTSSEYIRAIMGQPHPILNLSWVMENRKILIVNLGGIDEPSKLLATLIIAKIHQLMKRRWKLVQEGKTPIPFHLYVDEFSFFQIADVAEMLSFDGGYGLRLVIANQYKLSDDLREAIFNNIDSFIIFKVGANEARNYAHLTSGYYRDDKGRPVSLDIANIHKHWAFYCISGEPRIYAPTKAPLQIPEISFAQHIKDSTISTFGPGACKADPGPHNPESGKPEQEGTFLSNEAQEADSRSAGPVFRAAQQRSRTPSPKPRANPNRHTNDKPDP